MATIYAHTNDGYVYAAGSNFALIRGAGTGTSASSTGTASAYAIRSDVSAGRGGGSTYTVTRTFMYFDTSGISTDVQSATLKVYGYSQNSGDIIAVKATSGISSLATSDFDAITGWSSTSDGSGGGDNESNVTKYSDEITTWTSSGTYNDITLNSNALADMKNDDTLYICLINYDHDLKDIAPTAFTNRNGMYYSNYTGTSRDPYIDYTLAPAVATDNATFFGANF